MELPKDGAKGGRAMLPKDSAMLLSFVNMKLRDEYEDLSALCDDLELSEEEILAEMSALGYVYSAENRCFS